MRSTDRGSGVRTVTVVLVAVAAATVAAGADRLDRKVRVMERVIDEVLVQSEHVEVSSQRATRGLVLEGYGVVFTFDGRLGTGRWLGAGGLLQFSDGDDGGPTTWTVQSGVQQLQADLEEKREKAAAERREHRAGLQRELTDALLDYGATLNELDADDRVVIAAYLGDGFPFGGGDDDREQLVLSARYGDLQRFLAGDLSRQEAAALVRVDAD